MADNIAFGFLSIGLPDGLTVFIVSSLPFMGLRSGILISAFIGFGLIQTLVVCLAGSLAPAPLILFLSNRLLSGMAHRRSFASIVRQLKRSTLRKSRYASERIVLGLFVFAALPLPFTGVWASSVISAALGLDIRVSLLAIAAGTFAGAVIMIILSLIFPALFWI